MAYFRHTQQGIGYLLWNSSESWALTVSITANHHRNPIWFLLPWSCSFMRLDCGIFFLIRRWTPRLTAVSAAGRSTSSSVGVIDLPRHTLVPTACIMGTVGLTAIIYFLPEGCFLLGVLYDYWTLNEQILPVTCNGSVIDCPVHCVAGRIELDCALSVTQPGSYCGDFKEFPLRGSPPAPPMLPEGHKCGRLHGTFLLWSPFISAETPDAQQRAGFGIFRAEGQSFKPL